MSDASADRGTTAPSPEGPTVPRLWVHCPLPGRINVVRRLCHRLLSERRDLEVVLTMPEGTMPPPADGRLRTATLPTEAALPDFLILWRPAAVVWVSGGLRAGLLAQLRRRRIPMLLAEACEEAIDDPGWRLIKGRPRGITGFDRILAASANAARKLTRLGALPEQITVTGPLQEGGPALPFSNSDRSELTSLLEGRPAWLAATPGAAELPVILEAHRLASRLAHRLLLVLVPFRPGQGPELARQLKREGWRVADWAEGEVPKDETQILLAEGPVELGLWYRICPVTLIGGTLGPGLLPRDPMEAAVLGSAIIHGPQTMDWRDAFDNLARHGAARMVRDVETLTAAVTRMIAPDAAAAMAEAGWAVATEGAEATDIVIDWALERLDERGRDADA